MTTNQFQLDVKSGSIYDFYSAMWGPYYEAMLGILGSTGVILPFGDTRFGQPNATTFKTIGKEQLDFTWSEAPGSFTNPLNLTKKASWLHMVPLIDLNGSDEQADSPDNAYWTRGDGSNDGALTVGGWVNGDSFSDGVILAKWDETTGSELREWRFGGQGGDLRLDLYDESANASIGRSFSTNLSTSSVLFLLATYSGSGASSGINLYLDGVVVDDTDQNSGSYTAMEDLATIVTLGHMQGTGGTDDDLFNGRMIGGPLGLVFAHKELSADEALRMYELGRRLVGN